MSSISFYIDDREPWQELAKYLREFAEDLKIEVNTYKARLNLFDIIAVFKINDKKMKYGYELKRIWTDDFKQSLHSGHLHDQLKGYHQHKLPFWWITEGAIGQMSVTEQKALATVTAEIDGIGGHSKEVTSDRMAMYFIIQTVNIASGNKIIQFDPMVEPSLKDDSTLIKMLRQFSGMGDTAYTFTNRNFLEMFFNRGQQEAIRTMIDVEELKKTLSNYVRHSRNKNLQDKPLKVIEEFVKWFFG